MIRNIRLTSKFMTSQPDLQTIAIHILPYNTHISQSKGNQTMKFGQLIFKNYAENDAERLVRDLFLFCEKT